MPGGIAFVMGKKLNAGIPRGQPLSRAGFASGRRSTRHTASPSSGYNLVDPHRSGSVAFCIAVSGYCFRGYRLSSDGRGFQRENSLFSPRQVERIHMRVPTSLSDYERRGRTQRSAPTKGAIFRPSSAQAGKVAASAGVMKLVLTHFREKTERLMRTIEEDIRRDFGGEVILGRDLLDVEV